MGEIGAVRENVDEEDAKKEQTAITDASNASSRPYLLATISKQSICGLSLSRGKKTQEEEMVWFAHFLEPVAAHRSQTMTRRVLLCLTNTSGLGRTTRFKCGIKKERKKERNPDHQPGGRRRPSQVNSTTAHLQRARSGFGWCPM